MVSARTVLINMTIANEIEMRMGLAFEQVEKRKFIRTRSVRKQLDYDSGYALAFLCMSTVLQVLSAAWQGFRANSRHTSGLRAMQSLRPCQMIWWEKESISRAG